MNHDESQQKTDQSLQEKIQEASKKLASVSSTTDKLWCRIELSHSHALLLPLKEATAFLSALEKAFIRVDEFSSPTVYQTVHEHRKSNPYLFRVEIITEQEIKEHRIAQMVGIDIDTYQSAANGKPTTF